MQQCRTGDCVPIHACVVSVLTADLCHTDLIGTVSVCVCVLLGQHLCVENADIFIECMNMCVCVQYLHSNVCRNCTSEVDMGTGLSGMGSSRVMFRTAQDRQSTGW